MNRILGLSLALIMLVGLIGIHAFAYFFIKEPSSRSFVVGTLALKTNDADGVSQTLYATNMSAGDTAGPSTIALKNVGTANGATLDIAFSYTESDGSPNSVNKTADAVAALMEVTTLNYGGSSLLSSISDNNSNGYKDVYDLKNSSNLTGLSGIAASATKSFDIAVRLRGETGNDFQADGINVTMAFALKQ